MQWYSSCSM